MKNVTLPAVAFACAVLSASVLPQGTISPLYPIKDGFVSSDSCSGELNELIADDARQAASWLVFKSASIYYRNVTSAMLAVSIKAVPKPGLCGIHALMTRITAPENRVTALQVAFDDMPIAALPLDSTFSDQMILVNITELVQSRSFYGIALRPMRGLSARFSSKEGFPPPAILVYRDSLNPYQQPKWWTSTEIPDLSVGKEGDFFVLPTQGVIYRKSAAAWDSVAHLTLPPEPLPAAPSVKKSVRRSVRKRSL
jgi:hypothetical protein